MDKLIDELIDDLKGQENKIEKKSKKVNKSSKIVVKINEKGCVEVFGASGSQTALLSSICLILQEMEKYSSNSAEYMAKVILTVLEKRERND